MIPYLWHDSIFAGQHNSTHKQYKTLTGLAEEVICVCENPMTLTKY
jgi:hypothetical protein